MWRSIRDPDLLRAYASELGPKIPGFDKLVQHLCKMEGMPNLYAVTSLGTLRLTTAESFLDAGKHPAITILRTGAYYDVAFFPPNSKRASAWKACSPEDLIPTVELLLLRVALEA